MRNLIDYDLERDAVALVCSVACDTDESCINFLTSAASVLVYYPFGDEELAEETVETVNGSACFMIPESLLRTAGSFTVWADGKARVHFIVERTTTAGQSLTLCQVGDAFHIRGPAETSGSGGTGLFGFTIDENGHLICTYEGEPPALAINAEGHLIYTYTLGG